MESSNKFTANCWKPVERKIVQEPVCHICTKDLKTISHALVDCKFARKYWDTPMARYVEHAAMLDKKANYQGDWTGNFCVVDGVECQNKNMFLKERSQILPYQ